MNLAGKKILGVGGDLGGFKAIEPPLRRALDAGAQVELFLSVGSKAQFEAGNLNLDSRFAQVGGSKLFDRRDLIVWGASQTTEGWAPASNLINSMYLTLPPVLAVQDMYGSLHPALLRLGQTGLLQCIRRVCVTDEFSKNLLEQQVYVDEYPRDHVRGRLFAQTVVVTGGPQFDQVAALKERWSAARKSVRARLGAGGNRPVFLLVGGMNGTAEILSLVHHALRQTGLTDQARVVCRTHPTRASQLDQDLVAAKRAAMPDISFAASVNLSSEQLLPAADFVLSGYSTLNYFGILYGMPGVIYVGTPSFRADLWAEKQLEKPPEVEAGAGWYVQTADDLAQVIRSVQDGSPATHAMRHAQLQISQYNDGHATDRVFDEMCKLMQ